MNYRKLKTTLTSLVLLLTISSLHAEGRIDLYVACRAGDASTAGVAVKRNGEGEKVCVDSGNLLKGVAIKSVQLRYAKSLDLYMIFIYVDGSQDEKLASFTKKNVGRTLIISRGGVEIVRAYIVAPLVYGYINVAVPDEKSGHSLLERIAPSKKVP